ncbi:MAG: hypothetical protein K2X60_11065 [Xanthobacteraceae bacterium]|nr:hypothetical protein [Xanthobacteraceae bacterium]
MMRYRILASAFPLLVVGALAGGQLVSAAQPCISLGGASTRIATLPWQNQQHVSFTDDPKRASVRVQIVDSADFADFSVIDDMNTADATSCDASGETRYIGISTHASASEPVIYLSDEPGADYRIFVQSKTFSAREAAALLVGAAPVHARQLAASL